MNGEDWTNHAAYPAPPSLLCQFRYSSVGNAYVEHVWVAYAKDFGPTLNIANLEWRLTGIAREQLDRMPPEVRAQVLPQAVWGLGSGLMAQSEAALSGQQYGLMGSFSGSMFGWPG